MQRHLMFPPIPFPISIPLTINIFSHIHLIFLFHLDLVKINLRRLPSHFKMEKNPSNSDKSSPDREEKLNEDTTGVGRSYECTYCKRGFTNAQALGGHMNIHRKDKAKAKKKNQDESSNKSNENYAKNLRYFTSSHDHHEQQSGYYGGVGGKMDYQVYFPSSNPSVQTGNYLPVWKQEHDFGGPNLSLKIGISEENGVGDDDRKIIVKENEVDLELRLGHDP